MLLRIPLVAGAMWLCASDEDQIREIGERREREGKRGRWEGEGVEMRDEKREEAGVGGPECTGGDSGWRGHPLRRVTVLIRRSSFP